ncbi:hypothetical protein KM043_015481 [Ampulex compressa]|nr:hypothetical protein KM043_015481 [Ampulex compressa]
MWPIRYEMTRDECRKCLRCLELDAYGSMVSVLRAQGPFTSEKQRLLQELARVLHISNERHRAEIRRAVNDEKLGTIAEQLNGPNTGTDWTIEGRRTIPLLPRLKARTAFTTLANSLSLVTEAANEKSTPTHENMEDLKVEKIESRLQLKPGEKLSINTELIPIEDKLCNEKNSLYEVVNADVKTDTFNEKTNHTIIAQCVVSQKRKSPSPLPTAPPNKVLVVSSSSLAALNQSVDDTTLENNVNIVEETTNTSQHQNITIIPFTMSCVASNITAPKDVITQTNTNSHTLIPSSKYINTMASVPLSTARNKGRITMTSSKLGPKTTSTIRLSGNISGVPGNNVQSDTSSTQTQNNITAKPPCVSHNGQKNLKSENVNSNVSCIKQVTTIVHSNTKTTTTKSVITNNTQRVMTVCPGTTVSSGPGPPHVKQTTLTCKKLPSTALNHQSTAKMGVTLNSNKTVNISHNTNTKLAPKTNVIVIQKGHSKGVTLSHAGKEVLGKVIMGGKNLCVTSQHGTSAINVLPHHIALNNGDQAVTLLSNSNSSHTESLKSNIKSGNTIVFNLRQDVLEKNKVLSQFLESSSVLTAESKTVIQNANARLKEQSHTDLHILDNESTVKTDTVITSVKEENSHRRNKDIYTHVNSQVKSSINTTTFLGNKDILINTNQLSSTQDDTISNIQVEDTVCNSEGDMFDTPLDSAEINFDNFQYLKEVDENHVLEETRSPILSISQINNHNGS